MAGMLLTMLNYIIYCASRFLKKKSGMPAFDIIIKALKRPFDAFIHDIKCAFIDIPCAFVQHERPYGKVIYRIKHAFKRKRPHTVFPFG